MYTTKEIRAVLPPIPKKLRDRDDLVSSHFVVTSYSDDRLGRCVPGLQHVAKRFFFEKIRIAFFKKNSIIKKNIQMPLFLENVFLIKSG